MSRQGATIVLAKMTEHGLLGSERKSGFTAADDAIVIDLRRKGRGWQAVASALGRPRDNVRAHYDPTYVRLYEPAKPICPRVSLKAETCTPSGRAYQTGYCKPGGLSAQALLALEQIGEGVTYEVFRLVGAMRDETIATQHLTGLKARGLVTAESLRRPGMSGRGHIWKITDKGKAECVRLKEAPDA